MQNETAIKTNPFGFGDPNVAYAHSIFKVKVFLTGWWPRQG